MTKGIWRYTPPVLAVALLAAMAIAAGHRPQPADAAPFHHRVKAMAQRIPTHIGPWIATPAEVPPSAVALLHPNILKAWDFHNTLTGGSATLVVVQCKDARDMAGHYPPICYPASGWTQLSATPLTWMLGKTAIHLMRYRFAYPRVGRTEHITVLDFMVLPNGRIVRSMAGVWRAAASYQQHFFGAAQIQLVFPAGVSDAEQHTIFKTLLTPDLPLITALRRIHIAPGLPGESAQNTLTANLAKKAEKR